MEGYPENLSEMELPGLLKQTVKLMNLNYARRLFPYLVAFYIPWATLFCLNVFYQHDLQLQLMSFSSTLAGQVPPSGMVPPPTPPPVWSTVIIILAVEFLVGFIGSLGLPTFTTLTVASFYQWEETDFTYKRVAALVPGALWRLFLTSLWMNAIIIGTYFLTFVAVMIPYLLCYKMFGVPVTVALYIFVPIGLLIILVTTCYIVIFFNLIDEVVILEHIHGLEGFRRSKSLFMEKKMTVMSVLIFHLASAYIQYMVVNSLDLGPRWTKPIALVVGVVLVTMWVVFLLTLRTVLYFSCTAHQQQRQGLGHDLPSYANAATPLMGAAPAEYYTPLGNKNTD